MHTQTKVLDYYTPLLLLCPMHVLTQMESLCTKNLIGTQQLDFLDNCQCRLDFLDDIMHIEARAQVPIFDDTQMGYLSIVGTWLCILGHCYPFQGLFKT